MPNYSGHLVVNGAALAAAVGLIAVCPGFIPGVFNSPEIQSVAAASYVFATIFMSPDLDLSHSRSRRNWGRLNVIWSVYSRIFRHRGMSHHLFLGTVTRILYLGAVVLGFAVLGGVVEDVSKSGTPLRGIADQATSLALLRINEALISARANITFVYAVVAGLVMSDACHVIADIVWSRFKKPF